MRIIQSTRRPIVFFACSISLIFLILHFEAAQFQHIQTTVFQHLADFDHAIYSVQQLYASALYTEQNKQPSTCANLILHLRHTSAMGGQ